MLIFCAFVFVALSGVAIFSNRAVRKNKMIQPSNQQL